MNYERKTRNILYCDQSNVLLAHIIFFSILLTAFLFLSFHTANDVIGHVTIRLPWVDFLSVIHSGYASIYHHYQDMAV